MDIATLPPDQIASLVARILEDKDPATVGLRRIVRRKTAEAYDFPMRAFAVEDFAGVNKGSKALSDDEQRIIDLERQVIGLKKTAQEQARKARTAVQNAHAQGFDEGKKRGYDEGVEKAGAGHRRDLEALQASMTEFMRNLETEKNTLYASADRTMLELCRLMVKKIIAVDTHQHGEIILAVLRKALSYVAEKEKLVIRVSSRNAGTVSGNKEFWTPIAERLRDISIEPDERIQPGGCIIESNSGVVDGRIETQEAELTDVIEKAWESIHAQKNTPEAGG
jgi:flagellar biosynthesis/type III secretory pathway protein FliH